MYKRQALLKRESHDDLLSRLQAQFADVPEIAVAELPAPQQLVYEAHSASIQAQTPLSANRKAYARWWTASFSSLTRGLEAGSPTEESSTDAGIDAASPADLDDEDADSWGEHAQGSYQRFPKGARYGTLLHDLLEWQTQQGWPLLHHHSTPDDTTQSAWQQLLQRKTRGLGLSESDIMLLLEWLRQIAQCPLPLNSAVPGVAPLVLHRLTGLSVWPEMEFNFSAAGVASDGMDRLICQHVLPDLPRPALQTRELQGMLTGFMDLVCEHDGRYWVVDYKSNWLTAYDSAALNAAVLDKRYDVQYVLYLLALHRLLQSRLPGYDYDTHIGGAVYVFLRGIHSEGAGVHAMRPPRALIEQLDAAFARGLA